MGALDGTEEAPTDYGTNLWSIMDGNTFLEKKVAAKCMFTTYRGRSELSRVMTDGVTPLSSILLRRPDHDACQLGEGRPPRYGANKTATPAFSLCNGGCFFVPMGHPR